MIICTPSCDGTFNTARLHRERIGAPDPSKFGRAFGLAAIGDRYRWRRPVPPYQPDNQPDDQDDRQQWKHNSAQKKSDEDQWTGLADDFTFHYGIRDAGQFRFPARPCRP